MKKQNEAKKYLSRISQISAEMEIKEIEMKATGATETKREEYSRLEEEYKETVTQIAERLKKMRNTNHAVILAKAYLEGKKLKTIAKEMNFAYDYVRHMHGWALLEFEREVMNKGDY